MRHSLEFAATRNLVQDPRARRGRRAPGYASHCAGQYLGSVSPLDKYLVERYFKNTGFPSSCYSQSRWPARAACALGVRSQRGCEGRASLGCRVVLPGARYALRLVPLSLAQAVTKTTSLFVFLFGVIPSIATGVIFTDRCRATSTRTDAELPCPRR